MDGYKNSRIPIHRYAVRKLTPEEVAELREQGIDMGCRDRPEYNTRWVKYDKTINYERN